MEKEGTEPILVHSNKVKVNHGLIVIADGDDPERLNVCSFNSIIGKIAGFQTFFFGFQEKWHLLSLDVFTLGPSQGLLCDFQLV